MLFRSLPVDGASAFVFDALQLERGAATHEGPAVLARPIARRVQTVVDIELVAALCESQEACAK